MIVDPEAAERIRKMHPLQYGFLRNDAAVWGTENDHNPEIVERYNRCPTCEQWSPCDVRKLLEDALARSG